MEIGKATAIFKNIDQVAASHAEKIEAINEVVALDTHNGITKTDVLHALNWAMKYCLFLECQNFSLNSVRDFQKNDIDRLERRLKHLLQSDFIRSFDEIDVYTKEYKRDIRDADVKILYLCDGNKCENGYIECKYTTDITHAKNFEYDDDGSYWEKSEDVIDIQPTVKIPTAELDVQTTTISLIAGPNGFYTGCSNCNAHIKPNPHFKFCPGCGRKIISGCGSDNRG